MTKPPFRTPLDKEKQAGDVLVVLVDEQKGLKNRQKPLTPKLHYYVFQIEVIVEAENISDAEEKLKTEMTHNHPEHIVHTFFKGKPTKIE